MNAVLPALQRIASLLLGVTFFAHAFVPPFYITIPTARSTRANHERKRVNKYIPPLHATPPTSFKPAAEPLMTAGKSLASMGEDIIAYSSITSTNNNDDGSNDATIALLYAAIGADLRSAGDCLAQAAASCRFKTAQELVTDELREAGQCLQDAATKLVRTVDDDDDASARNLASSTIFTTIESIQACGTALEQAGATILQGGTVIEVGRCLVAAGTAMQTIVFDSSTVDSSYTFAQQTIRAGENLQGIEPKAAGKNWMKPYSVE